MRQHYVHGTLMSKLGFLFYALRLRLAWSPGLGRAYAQWLGIDVGEGAVIYNASFGSEPWLIKIGNNSWVTAGCQFITHDGSITVLRNGPFGVEEPDKLNRYGSIIVGDNCFIGVRSIIMPNVHIGDNCIVAAGSVVTRDVPAGSIVGGNPARVIGSVADYAEKVKRESLPIPSRWPNMQVKKATIRALFFEQPSGEQ